MAKRSRKQKLFEKVSKNLSKIASVVSAVVILVGAATGLCSWVSGQFANAVSEQISDFREETKESDKKQEQAITRVELMVLIEHDPYNAAAIEKMARYYFRDLDGDLYMTQKYSEWAKAYDGDISIILGVK